jgi:cyclopropane fatty-acyl-phospholipid synthase-like methyltransferase
VAGSQFTSRKDASKLPPGSPEHYSSYIGPPHQFDFMGATQFRLACSLGLRENHKFLDFGCGSLRAGRLLIPYLDKGCYFGIEPNSWLVDEGIKNEIGEAIIRRKECRFDHNDRFDSSVFGETFDFIVAQSIFSHTGRAQVEKCLAGFKSVLRPDGLILATFLPTAKPSEDHRGDDWVYPECVLYTDTSITGFAHGAGLDIVRIPWFHPRQVWYLMAHERSLLPSDEDIAKHLTGVVLRAPDIVLET